MCKKKRRVVIPASKNQTIFYRCTYVHVQTISAIMRQNELDKLVMFDDVLWYCIQQPLSSVTFVICLLDHVMPSPSIVGEFSNVRLLYENILRAKLLEAYQLTLMMPMLQSNSFMLFMVYTCIENCLVSADIPMHLHIKTFLQSYLIDRCSTIHPTPKVQISDLTVFLFPQVSSCKYHDF